MPFLTIFQYSPLTHLLTTAILEPAWIFISVSISGISGLSSSSFTASASESDSSIASATNGWIVSSTSALLHPVSIASPVIKLIAAAAALFILISSSFQCYTAHYSNFIK